MCWYPDLRVAVAVQFPTDDVRKAGPMKRLCAELAGLCREAKAVRQGK
jgi:hypothetical protein